MSSKRHHAEWLSLVEVSGPFLTMPVLERVFPQGLDAHDPEHYRNLRLAFEEWEEHPEKPALHRAWIKYVLKQTLSLPEEVLAEGQAIPETLKATISEHGETLRPDFVIRNPEDIPPAGQARLLIQVYPPEQDLEKAVAERHWKASPATRMMELLHAADVRLGLVTNGERWMMVYAPRGETTGYASWYASLWMEEKITLQAFRSLLGAHRFFNTPDDQTLDAMLAESAKHQQEVTDQLGYQVRRAVETLINSLDRADLDSKRELLSGVPETELYESALTVMMRLVFLFCAEERGLLLLGDPLYDQHYAVSTLIAQLQEAADQHGEEVLERRLDAWSRLLATFRAVYGGIEHERLKLPAYGGRLFDPDRFPFLEGRAAGTKWREISANPLPVNNRSTLHLLRSLQYLEMQGEARRLSFRALDIEQIGHVYEGLLDHTAKRAATPVLGLIGAKGDEPEVALTELERMRERGENDLIAFLRDQTGKSENTLRRLLETELDTQEINRMRAACGNDDALFKRVRPFAALVRDDSFDHPVVIPQGSVYVTSGTDRRSSGTHYTPRSLTEPIVQYTLEPLVYIGPAEGKPKEEWRLRSPRELLDLKICDMACGSGAFLVQACRYLSERLVEAWEEIEHANPGSRRITPEGAPATGALDEALIPQEIDERLSYAQRIIAQRCLYGVDKNPLAVEMAKLSLWLLTLAKDKPFTFLDHAIRRGDSLIGIHRLDQIRYFTLDLGNKQKVFFTDAMEDAVATVIALRKRIENLPTNNVEDVELQRRLLDEAEVLSKRLSYAADLLLSVEFRGASVSQKEELRIAAAVDATQYFEHHLTEESKAAVSKALGRQATFHWPLEFPEVFVERGGFDAFIGNPPFSSVRLFAYTLGVKYAKHLFNENIEARGNVDLSAFFLRRAFRLLSVSGGLGLVLTNSISEGANRLASLDPLLSEGRIYHARNSLRWPGTANVFVSLIHITRQVWSGPCQLGDSTCKRISSNLVAEDDGKMPYKLVNLPCASFRGSDWNGKGFLVDEQFVRQHLKTEPLAKEYLLPCLNAREYCDSPTQKTDRWIVFFRDLPLDLLNKRVPHLVNALRDRVYEERLSSDDARLKQQWWLFRRATLPLYEMAWRYDDVFVVPFTGKYPSFSSVSSKQVFANALNVFVGLSWDGFAVLQSSIHEAWVFRYCSRMKTDIRYAPSDLFETFPFPINVLNGSDREELITFGMKYHDARRLIMDSRQEGLTKTYNRFHDPEEKSADIRRLRELHQEMDEAVARAYGWTDLRLNHGFHETKQSMRFTISEAARREVLDRLLELNHQRYAKELAEGLHEKGAKKKAGTKRGAKGKSVISEAAPGGVKRQAELFATSNQKDLFEE